MVEIDVPGTAPITVGGAIDGVVNNNGTNLAKANAAAQLASVFAGATANINPFAAATAISLSQAASATQLAVLVDDLNKNGADSVIFGDLATLFGDEVTTASAAFNLVPATKPLDVLLDAIGTSLTVLGFFAAHTDEATALLNQAENELAQTATAAGTAAMGYASQAINGLQKAVGDALGVGSQSALQQNLDVADFKSAGQAIANVANSVGLTFTDLTETENAPNAGDIAVTPNTPDGQTPSGYSSVGPQGVNSTINFPNGTSSIINSNSDGSSTATTYNGPNGTGSINQQVTNTPAGTSTIMTYNSDGSSTTKNYSEPDGNGSTTSSSNTDIYGNTTQINYGPNDILTGEYLSLASYHQPGFLSLNGTISTVQSLQFIKLSLVGVPSLQIQVNGPVYTSTVIEITNATNTTISVVGLPSSYTSGAESQFVIGDTEDPAWSDIAVGGLDKDADLGAGVTPNLQISFPNTLSATDFTTGSGLSFALSNVSLGSGGNQEAAADINTLYQNLLDRPVDPGGLASWQAILAQPGGSLNAVQTGIAYSAEAAADVEVLYQQLLDRTADSAGVASWQAALAQPGGSLNAVQAAIADSAEAANDIGNIYQQALGRTADPAGVASWQAALAQPGGSLNAVQTGIANSAEAAADINGIYGQILGRSADAGGVTSWQAKLAQPGGSLTGIRAGVAGSAEAANDIGSIYQQILGRPADAAGLAHWQTALAQGGGSLSTVKAAIIGSAEATADINQAFSSAYNSPPSASQFASETTQLTDGLSLAQITQQLQISRHIQTFSFISGGETLTSNPAEEFQYTIAQLGHSAIIGFNPATSVFDVDKSLNYSTVLNDETVTGSGVQVSFDANNSITFLGLKPTDLSAVNFKFV